MSSNLQLVRAAPGVELILSRPPRSHPHYVVSDPPLLSPRVSLHTPLVASPVFLVSLTAPHPHPLRTPPTVLKLAGGLAVEDVDFWEINEAFASQAVYSIKKLGIDFEKVNLNGGAIAIGQSRAHVPLDRGCRDMS